MIELTEQQVQALEGNGTGPVEVVSPRTGQRFVLLRALDYAKLVDDGYDYDDGDWSQEERDALAFEARRLMGWDEDEYPEYNPPEAS